MQEPCHLCFIIIETFLHETMKVFIAELYIMTLEQTQVTQHDLGMYNVNYTCIHVAKVRPKMFKHLSSIDCIAQL